MDKLNNNGEIDPVIEEMINIVELPENMEQTSTTDVHETDVMASGNGSERNEVDLTSVPKDFGGHERKEHLDALGKLQVRVHTLTGFEPSQVMKYAECMEQMHNKGVTVQAIDFVHKTLHRPLLTMLREDGHLVSMADGAPLPFSTALSLLREAMNKHWQIVLDTIKKLN